MRKHEHINHDLSYIEELLQSTLLPVTPRAEFLRELHHRLAGSPVEIVESPARKNPPYLLLPLVSLFLGLLIITTNVRIILSIVGVIGVAQQLRNSGSQKRISSTSAV